MDIAATDRLSGILSDLLGQRRQRISSGSCAEAPRSTGTSDSWHLKAAAAQSIGLKEALAGSAGLHGSNLPYLRRTVPGVMISPS
jgi:hypothetical protein